VIHSASSTRVPRTSSKIALVYFPWSVAVPFSGQSEVPDTAFSGKFWIELLKRPGIFFWKLIGVLG
jgi:hypothetical protein